MPFIIAAGAAAGLGAGIMGMISSSAQRDAAQNAINEAVAQIKSSGLPPNESAPILINKLQAAGVLTPEMEQNINLQMSKVAAITDDPTFKNAQIDTLQQMKQRAEGGLTPQDQAAFQQMRNQVEGETQRSQQAIIQNAQQRGQAGGGTELAAQLEASQGGANRLSQGAMQQAGTASQNALQALAGYGNLANQGLQQGFQENVTKGQAADAVNAFNVQNALAIQRQNTQASNQAQASNLANAQNISNANTNAANQELYRQAAAQQQYYNALQQHNQNVANAYLGQAANYNQQAGQTGQAWQNVGTGLAGAAGAFGNYAAGQNAADQRQDNFNTYMQGAYPETYGQGYQSQGYNPNTAYAPGAAAPGPYAPQGFWMGGQTTFPMNQGGMVPGYNEGCYVQGGQVPGHAPVAGDSPKNDIVKAELSPDEIVIPRSHTGSYEDACAFLKPLMLKGK